MIAENKLNLYSLKTLQEYIDKFKNEPHSTSLPCPLSKVKEEIKRRERTNMLRPKREYVYKDYKEALEIVLSMARSWQDSEDARELTTTKQQEAIECLETLKENIEFFG